jgi:predicted ATPase/DNA-binding CsgD family transcriptional regulator
MKLSGGETFMLKQIPVMRPQKHFTHKSNVVKISEYFGEKKASDCFSPCYIMTRLPNDSAGHSSSLPGCSGWLFGREQELEALTTLLCASETRLVTLTGPGGVGKTRLALHVATNLRDNFIDGVYFVSLASISHPDEVLAAIAQVLSIEKSNDRPLLDVMEHALRHKRLLLLIDTMEHVITAAPYLAYLLVNCSDLTMLVTSRRELNLRGEQTFSVPPLAVPDLSALPATYEDLLQYPAVALFMQRVRAVYPDFQLTGTDAGTIAEICVHLDGLPLALELAAIRMKLMSPQGLLQRLRSSATSLSVLTSGMRDAPTRHQTLRQNIAWSYSLLTPQEQRVFQRLSIFENSYTFTAIEGVCCDDDTGAQRASLVDCVHSLIEQNLLQMRWDKEKDEPRFMLLGAIRAYGQECLKKSGEEAAARQAHAAYHLALRKETRSGADKADQQKDLYEEVQMREKQEASPVPLSLPSTNLTAREIEVLCLIAQGLTSLQIAQRLTITTLTVNSHVRSIYNKLGINTRSAATRYAIEQNLL